MKKLKDFDEKLKDVVKKLKQFCQKLNNPPTLSWSYLQKNGQKTSLITATVRGHAYGREKRLLGRLIMIPLRFRLHFLGWICDCLEMEL